jgi:acyl-[acyl-carrier-protein] desaturase
MELSLSRQEVMQYIEPHAAVVAEEMLKPIEENWQPSDLLPDSSNQDFFKDVKEIQEQAENLSYDFLAVLIGDTLTEEALPTYESWLMGMKGVNIEIDNAWMKWIRGWTAEENRHGDALSRYLYLCGRIDMKEFEASMQYLIAAGFDIQTGTDPYKNFIYTSFQEMATNISHRRVASIAKQSDNMVLSKICGLVASDETRHAKAYKSFVSKIFEIDANEMMLAFEYMMRKKIVMPAHLLRETGDKINTFANFSDAAQRLEVYTSLDYVDILKSLIDEWELNGIKGLKENGEKARDYIMALPDRLLKVAERMKTPEVDHKFNWILA